VRVTLTDEATVESPEDFFLRLTSASANATIAREWAMATIIDNDGTTGTPVLRMGDAVVDEASGLVQVAVTLDRPSVGGVTLDYAVRAATATAGTDFTPFSGQTVGFAPGEMTKTIAVGILNDGAVEAAEVFDIDVVSVVGATVGDGRGHIVIDRNDQASVPAPVLDLRDVVTLEGQGYVDFLLTLSAPSANVVTVSYNTATGSASTSDFGAQSGLLRFAPGETIKTIRISTIEDLLVEGPEVFTLHLTSPINATLGYATATATIIDDDSAVPAAPVVLNGTSAADILRGSPFVDAISGGAGDDLLDGGPGDDSLSGGVGDDIYVIEDAGDSYTESEGEGEDLVISYLPSFTLGANVENLQLAGSAITGIGNSLNNRIAGSIGNNSLDGGTGADTMSGGDGDDEYQVDNLGDIVIETSAAAAGGTDIVYTMVSHTLSANVENLRIMSPGSVNGTGNALDNI
ncbi:MAG: hypothetical protein KDI64_18635, partial [Candidatus Accumulibacter sp.]|nr:hypothetical protein [Accumulibacter sp.]